MDLIDAGPLRSCSNGGRKVYMLFESQIAENVEPIFLLYDRDGKRLEEMNHILTQPNDLKYKNVKNVAVLKETIIFITPPQPNIEMIMKNGWLIKLAVMRGSHGFESSKKFKFNYVPDDFYDPCIFCELKPDGDFSKAVLPNLIKPLRPGIKKRGILEILKYKDLNLPLISENQLNNFVPKYRFGKIPCLDNSLSNGLPTPGKHVANNADPLSHEVCGNLRLKPISSLHKIQTSQTSLKIDAENDIGFQAYQMSSATIQDLIENETKSLKHLPNLIPIKKSPLKLKSRSTEVSFKAFLEQQITEPTMPGNLLFTTNKNMEKSLHCPYLWDNTDCLGNHRPHFKETQKRSFIDVITTRPGKTKNYKAKNLSFKNKHQFDQLSAVTPDTTSQHLLKGNRRRSSDKLPKHKVESLLKSLENSQSLQGFVNNHYPMQKKKAPEPVTSSKLEMLADHLLPSYQSELDILNDLDVLDMIFQPLPTALNDKLKTKYNYAYIGKRVM